MTGDLGQLLRTYRGRRGLSQQALADLSTVSARAIRDLEAGRARRPRKETLRLLSDALRIAESQRQALEMAAGPAPDTDDTFSTPFPVPVPTGAMLGRTDEMRVLRDFLDSGERVISVVGLAGVGKSRLVQELALQCQLAGGEPVHWLTLDAGSELPRTLADTLGTAPAVLVLDGFRNRGPFGGAVRALLHQRPRLRVIVTTTDPWSVLGDAVLPLAPLGRDAALSLLLRRMGLPDLVRRPGSAELAALHALGRLTDGVPAVLDAVARLGTGYHPAGLLRRLSTDPGPVMSAHPTVAGIRKTLRLLTPRRRATLGALVDATPGRTIDDLAAHLGRAETELVEDLRFFVHGGLVRRVVTEERIQFESLNLTRTAWHAEAAERMSVFMVLRPHSRAA